MSTIIVSVIIPVFNCENSISKAVKSVLHQTLNEVEVIVVDDGSHDKTLEKLSSINDSRLKVLTNDENKGISFSLNKAIENSSGQYIARMDGDDIAAPERIEKQLLRLREENVDIVGCGVKTYGAFSSIWLAPETDESIKFFAFFQCPIFHPTVLGKKEIFERFTYDCDFDGVEDYEIWTRMIKNDVKFYNIQEPLLEYYVSSDIREKRDQEGKLRLKKKFLKNNLNFDVSIFDLKLLNSFWRLDKMGFLELFRVILLVKRKVKNSNDQLLLYRKVKSYFRLYHNKVLELLVILSLRF